MGLLTCIIGAPSASAEVGIGTVTKGTVSIAASSSKPLNGLPDIGGDSSSKEALCPDAGEDASRTPASCLGDVKPARASVSNGDPGRGDMRGALPGLAKGAGGVPGIGESCIPGRGLL